MSVSRPDPVAWGFAAGNVALALVVVFGVFFVLPLRWWAVDVPAGLGAALLVAATVGCLRPSPTTRRLAVAASAALLIIGLAALTAVSLAAAFLNGVHGVLGRGASMLYLLLIIPVGTWLVLFPALQLGWLHRRAAG